MFSDILKKATGWVLKNQSDTCLTKPFDTHQLIPS